MKPEFCLPDNLLGRSITVKVIPTVYNIKNLLEKLQYNGWNTEVLKPWELRCYKGYRLDLILSKLKNASATQHPEIIRTHIISNDISIFGAHIVDIYLVAYFTENYSTDFADFYIFTMDRGITNKENSAHAIWQVGKSDGAYLNILNKDGTIKDWDFMKKLLRIN